MDDFVFALAFLVCTKSRNVKEEISMDARKLDYRNILGDPMTRAEVLKQIAKDKETYEKFQELTEELQEEIIAFCMGNRGLKMTYDPFFKYIFNPSVHDGRLAEVLSLLLGEEVEIVAVLPNESDRISDSGSLLVMDILVKLKSGAYANVEIQKVGYLFQGERCACYSADLLMRQLARERAKAKDLNIDFKYKSIKKVYTIVLMEKAPSVYWDFPDEYIHYSKQIFNTGLELDLLQEYFMIPLDVFKEMSHNKINKLEAWLYFIGSDSPKDICRVIEAFPEFRELYNELLMLRYKTKELVNMFDVIKEALRAADEGTVKYMVEEQQKEIAEQRKTIAEQSEQLAERDEQLAEQAEQLAREREENKRLREALLKQN